MWCSHSHGTMGVLIFAYVSDHHESLDTHCPLDVSQECFDHFQKVVGIPDTLRETRRSKWGVWKMEIFPFPFVHLVGLPHSTHQPASVLPAFPPFSGLQGWWSMPQGMQPDRLECHVLHWTAWMPVQSPYHYIAQ